DAGPDRTLDQWPEAGKEGACAAQASGRKGRRAASGQAGSQADQADQDPGRLYRGQPERAVQIGRISLLKHDAVPNRTPASPVTGVSASFSVKTRYRPFAHNAQTLRLF